MNTSYKEKYNGLMKMKESVDVLFLGNSHANYSVNPFYINNYVAYNLAHVSQKIYFDKRLTIKVINEGVSNLKYVFISVDYHSLYTSTQGIRNVWSYYSHGIKYKNQNYFKADISPFLWGYTPKPTLKLMKDDFLNYFKYKNIKIIDFNVHKGVSLTDSVYNGFIGYSSSSLPTINKQVMRKRALNFKENEFNSERKEVIKDLNDFILYLKSKKIQPILFSSPTYKEYNEFLDPKIRERNIADIDAICKLHDIQYWEFIDDSRFDKEDFFDQDHLNKKGAKKFSILLNTMLTKYDQKKI